MTTGITINHLKQSACKLAPTLLRRNSRAAGNKKINANFLFGGFTASHESLWVIKQLCFVSTVMRKLLPNKKLRLSLMRYFHIFTSDTFPLYY